MNEEHDHGLAKGTHEGHDQADQGKKKDHKLAIIGLAVAGVGVLVTLFVAGNGGGSSTTTAAQPTDANGSTPFVPNGTDTSYGMSSPDESAMMLPILSSIIAAENTKKKSNNNNHWKDHSPHQKKDYGHSPNGNTHGHTVSPKNGSHPGTHHSDKGDSHHGG